MNKTTKTILATAITALALSLTACGGGSSDSGGLPSGVVGTKGDGVNQAEYDAVQCGMNKEQVTAIVGDAPTIISADIVWNWNYPTMSTQIAFTSPTGVVKHKNNGPAGNPPTTALNC